MKTEKFVRLRCVAMVFVSDETVGRNLTKLRGDVSMDVLAAKMRDSGHSWSKTTVFNVEHGKRQLKYSEAVDVLVCLGYDPVNSLEKLLVSGIDVEVENEIETVLDLIQNITQKCFELGLADARLVKLIDPQFREDYEGWYEGVPSPKMREKAREVINFIDGGRCLETFKNNMDVRDAAISTPLTLDGVTMDGERRWWNAERNAEAGE